MGSCVSRPISKKHHSPRASAVGPPLKLKDFFIAPAVTHSGSKDETFFDSQPWFESDCDEDFYSVDGGLTPSRICHTLSTGTPLVLTPSRGHTPLNSNIPTGAPRLAKVRSTPSRTSTPLHDNFAAATTQSNKVVAKRELAGHAPENSPKYKKKRLLELFRLSRGGFADESIFSDNSSADTKTVPGHVFTPIPSISGATSVCSSERISNGSIKSHRNKALKSVHPSCCLPKMLTVRYNNEKRMDVHAI